MFEAPTITLLAVMALYAATGVVVFSLRINQVATKDWDDHPYAGLATLVVFIGCLFGWPAFLRDYLREKRARQEKQMP